MPRTVAFFDGYTAAAGAELWETDGTAAGSVLVTDIIPGTTSSLPANFTPTGTGTIVFSASDGRTSGPELFVSNGIAAGTVELNSSFVRVLFPVPVLLGVSLSNFTPLGNGRVLFTGPTSPALLQVWATDGTVAGTQLILDLAGAGALSNSVSVEALGGGRAVFQVRAGATAGLWTTDGTPTGTVQLLSLSTSLVGALGDGRGLFTMPDNNGGTVLAVTDGMANGTRSIHDFSGGYQGGITATGGKALFAASDGLSPSELWATDGTAAGTTKLAQGFARSQYSGGGSSIGDITALGQGRFVFAATGTDGNAALWATDGTTAGTALVEEIGGGDPNYSIDGITALGGGKALLEVTYKATYGSALLVTDGTAAGTAVLQKFAPAEQYLSALGSIATLPGGVAVFGVAEGQNGFQVSDYQVWRTDGTAAGTAKIAQVGQGASGAAPSFTVLPDGRALFDVSNTDGTRVLWATSGTAASTGPVANETTFGGSGIATVADLDPLFDTDYYNAHNPDVAAAGLNAYQHYLAYGGTEGRSPDPFFDGSYYLAQNPDVAKSGMSPLTHFELYGWHEGRDPSLLFSVSKYEAAYRDVAASGLDPLAHYQLYGQAEGRITFLTGGTKPADPLVNASFYDKQLGATLIPTGTGAAQQAAASYDASGWQKGLNPDALFDTKYYLAHNPDVAAAHVDPLLHYEQFGWHEGRNPSAAFSTNGYLQHNADVTAAGVDPLLHYVVYGQAEGRAIYPA